MNIEININVNNVVKYAVGNKIFDELKKKYYYNVNELIQSCNKYNIFDIDSYKSNFKKYSRLPHPDYFNNGFYAELKNFNFDVIISQNLQYFDY